MMVSREDTGYLESEALRPTGHGNRQYYKVVSSYWYFMVA